MDDMGIFHPEVVGGCNPSENYARKKIGWKSSRIGIGMKIINNKKMMSCQHPVILKKLRSTKKLHFSQQSISSAFHEIASPSDAPGPGPGAGDMPPRNPSRKTTRISRLEKQKTQKHRFRRRNEFLHFGDLVTWRVRPRFAWVTSKWILVDFLGGQNIQIWVNSTSETVEMRSKIGQLVTSVHESFHPFTFYKFRNKSNSFFQPSDRTTFFSFFFSADPRDLLVPVFTHLLEQCLFFFHLGEVWSWRHLESHFLNHLLCEC